MPMKIISGQQVLLDNRHHHYQQQNNGAFYEEGDAQHDFELSGSHTSSRMNRAAFEKKISRLPDKESKCHFFNTIHIPTIRNQIRAIAEKHSVYNPSRPLVHV